MSLNEWMNEERNILLREKFGLPLREELDNKVDFKQQTTAESDGTDMKVEEDDDEECAELKVGHPLAPEELEEDEDTDYQVNAAKARVLVSTLIEKALKNINKVGN